MPTAPSPKVGGDPSGGKDIVVPHGKPTSSLKVKVLLDPVSTFYKDEGGKANHLVTTVCLENLENPKTQHIGKIFLKPNLCYENGRDVEDAIDIFKVQSMEPKMVSSTDQKIVVKFRIEKVSRRKDGQRFKIRFDLDQTLSSTFFNEVQGVYTAPICVLSKRKFPSQNSKVLAQKKLCTNKRSKQGTKSVVMGANGVLCNTRRNGLSKTEAATMETILAMRRTISSLEQKVNTLTDRVQFLEKENILHKERRDSISSHASPDPASIQPSDMMHVSKFKLDYEDHDVLRHIEDDEFEPRGLNSTGMMFNFGLPSSDGIEY